MAKKKILNANNEKSSWKNSKEAMEYFSVGRGYLDKIAQAAGAKRILGRKAFYNVEYIEEYLEDLQ
jgi:hypothetical protein